VEVFERIEKHNQLINNLQGRNCRGEAYRKFYGGRQPGFSVDLPDAAVNNKIPAEKSHPPSLDQLPGY
jgi:hypothetical protein